MRCFAERMQMPEVELQRCWLRLAAKQWRLVQCLLMAVELGR